MGSPPKARPPGQSILRPPVRLDGPLHQGVSFSVRLTAYSEKSLCRCRNRLVGDLADHRLSNARDRHRHRVRFARVERPIAQDTPADFAPELVKSQ